jgi:flagellar motor switch protein FliN/FliY
MILSMEVRPMIALDPEKKQKTESKPGIEIMSELQTTNDQSSRDKVMEDLRHFFDIPISIAIQLADRSMKVRDILQLQPNSIVELPKSAGENMDILANGRFIASGEVLELEDSTGIRLTDLGTVT